MGQTSQIRCFINNNIKLGIKTTEQRMQEREIQEIVRLSQVDNANS